MRFAFLDRDGVLNRFPGKGKYVTRSSQMRLIPGSALAVAALTKAGYTLAVISNQGCVSRGLLSRAGLRVLTRKMLADIGKSGGKISRIYYCEHQKADACACKKPKTLLLERAVRGKKLRRSEIYFIGDSEEDILAGKNFGCRTLLVLSGRLKKRDVAALAVKPDTIKKNLREAAQWLLRAKH